MMTSLSSALNAQSITVNVPSGGVCTAIDVPYFEDFNANILPTCTSTQVISGGTAWQANLNSLYINDTGPDPDSWFYTQGINLQAGKVYKIKFGYSAYMSPQSFKVAYGTSPVNTSMTNIIQEFLNIPSIPFDAPFIPASLTVTPSITGVYYFGFNYIDGDPWMLRVDDLSITLQSTLSASEVEHLKNDVEVYPNPATDDLLVKNSQKNTGAEILDISGRVVLSLEKINEKIDVSQLVKGTYFLVIKNEDGTLSKTKFIKK